MGGTLSSEPALPQGGYLSVGAGFNAAAMHEPTLYGQRMYRRSDEGGSLADLYMPPSPYARMDLFNSTVAAEPHAHPKEFALQSIGREMGLDRDTQVIPILNIERRSTTGATGEREMHRDEVFDVPSLLPTNYNYGARHNRLRVLMAAHVAPNSVLDGEPARSDAAPLPTLLMHADVPKDRVGTAATAADVLAPPEGDVVTYFTPEDVHSGPLEPRLHSSLALNVVAMVDPHMGTPVYVSEADGAAQFDLALGEVEEVLDTLKQGIDVGKAVAKFIKNPKGEASAETAQRVLDEYATHRRAHLFSTQFDDELRTAMETILLLALKYPLFEEETPQAIKDWVHGDRPFLEFGDAYKHSWTWAVAQIARQTGEAEFSRVPLWLAQLPAREYVRSQLGR